MGSATSGVCEGAGSGCGAESTKQRGPMELPFGGGGGAGAVVRGVGGEGATAPIVRPTSDSARSVVSPASRLNTRADPKGTRSGSVMMFPAIARCITQAGGNDSRNGVAIEGLSDAAAAWGRRRRHVIAA